MANDTNTDPVGKQTADLVGEKKSDVVDAVATDLAKDAVAQEAKLSTGNEAEVDTRGARFLGSDEIMQWEHNLALDPDAFAAAIDPKSDHPIPENKVYGLLALERNGKNRTEYVKAMMKRLGLKGSELPGGGPPYTNDTTPISKL